MSGMALAQNQKPLIRHPDAGREPERSDHGFVAIRARLH